MEVSFRQHRAEEEAKVLREIDKLLSKDLSEPYSIYVYQYFVKHWPSLTFIAENDQNQMVGVIVASQRAHKDRERGYIAMLAVHETYRGRGIAKRLIKMVVEQLAKQDADEVTLETETTNVAALKLYQSMGFIRTRRMHQYYLNTNDAFRLVLPLTDKSPKSTAFYMPPPQNVI